MAAIIIGKIKSCEIKWDQNSKDIYVHLAFDNWTHIGKASSANEAMVKAEAWLYNR